jgi:APA family basic amino acid/polyamine antiporter
MDPSARARPLGFPALLALGVNGIVGVGIFFAPASVAAELPGSAGVWIYVATALAMLPIASSYAALGSRFSVDGGPYVWASAAFGERFGFLVGWLTFVSALFSVAAVATGLSEHAAPLFGVTSSHGIRAFAVACILTVSLVAASGLKPSSVVWSAVTVLKLVPLVTLVVLGIAAYGRIPSRPVTVVHDVTAHAIERAVLVVVFASQGFEIVPLLAGSVRRSERAVPLATVSSLIFATILYSLLHALAVHAVPNLGESHAPLVDAARVYGGSVALALVAAGANVSALGILFGMFNTTPRYLSTLSGPRAFGPWIGEVDTRVVPQRALWITATSIIVMVLLSSHLTELFVLSSLAVLAQYSVTLASLSVLAFRRSNGLSRKHLWAVPLSFVGIFLAARGAELREVGVAAGVVGGGELLRRFTNKKPTVVAAR